MNIFVGDFGKTEISKKCLDAFGLKSLPIDKKSSTQRRNLKKMNEVLKVVQFYEFAMGRIPKVFK